MKLLVNFFLERLFVKFFMLRLTCFCIFNSRKSTFFNVLTKSQATAENFPFCTIGELSLFFVEIQADINLKQGRSIKISLFQKHSSSTSWYLLSKVFKSWCILFLFFRSEWKWVSSFLQYAYINLIIKNS